MFEGLTATMFPGLATATPGLAGLATVTPGLAGARGQVFRVMVPSLAGPVAMDVVK
jgi:hypothetical protein